MFKFFFWKWFTQPQVGDVYFHPESNPFTRSKLKVIGIREDWVKVERFSTDPRFTSEYEIMPVQDIIAFYKKEGRIE